MTHQEIQIQEARSIIKRAFKEGRLNYDFIDRLTPNGLYDLLEVFRDVMKERDAIAHLLARATFERDLYASGAIGSTFAYPDEAPDYPCRVAGHDPKDCIWANGPDR